MEMTILQRDDDITHVILTGRLDTIAAEQFETSFSDATAARNRPAIVDLSQVEFMASRGIGMLLVNGKKLARAGHKLVLLNPQEIVASNLLASRTEVIMPVAYDTDEAIRILRGDSGRIGAPSPRPRTSTGQSRSQQPTPVSTASSAVEALLKVAIKNEMSELQNFSAAAAEFLAAHSVPHRAAYAVDLAIEELIVNVIRYAYVDDDAHVIDVELAIEGDQVVLRIDDDGMPFDPRKSPVLNVHAEDREVGGLGLILVLDMVDVLKYHREEERNRVEVRIRLAAEEEDGALSEAAGHLSEESESSNLL